VQDPSFSSLRDLVRQIDPRAGNFDPVAMPGGASVRRYFRLTVPGAIGKAVAMFVPEELRGAGASSEKMASAKPDVERRWPFLEVHDLLADCGVRVPKVLSNATPDGWLLIEDLGDDTVASYLEKRPSERVAIYQTAVRDLARAQKALASLPADSVVRTRSFDYEVLRWELDHFLLWGIDARGLTISAADRSLFDAVADRLAARIASWPYGFVHRDYQSRNLMVVPAANGSIELCWIDFQDALLGPRHYDLVALLHDSYQKLDPAFVDDRVREYRDLMGLSGPDRDEFRRGFDLVSVQRKLKDAGRFVFIDRKKGDPGFLPFVEPTLAKVRYALGRLTDEPDMVELTALLGRVLGW
jgi:aminoglycoside/choline kinase family phosphotransferase